MLFSMQKIKSGLSRYSERNWNVLLYLFLIGVCQYIASDWARSTLFFCLMPFQMYLVYKVIRNRKLHKTALFRIATAFLLWMFFTYIINDRWYAEGLIGLQALLMCWYAALFVPEDTDLQGIHREIFGIGMIFIICYLPFMLLAMLSVYTGKLIYVPFDPYPIGIQTAGSIGDRIRVMMNTNYISRIAIFNMLFSVYGILTRKKKGFRIFFAFVILLNLLILAHTQSRTCYIAFGMALGMIAFREVFLLIKKKGLRVAAAALALILVFFAVVYGMSGVLKLDMAIAKRTSGVNEEPEQDFYIGAINITPFATPHDANQPVGISFECGGARFVIATDVGCLRPGWMNHVLGADAVLLESNYDPDMLKAGSYPYELKRRILSTHGHLCNEDAGSFCVELAKNGTRHIVLGHLSKENNFPELALRCSELSLRTAGIEPGRDMRLDVAKRDEVTGIFAVTCEWN